MNLLMARLNDVRSRESDRTNMESSIESIKLIDTLDENVIGSPFCACSNRRRRRHWYRISSSLLSIL